MSVNQGKLLSGAKTSALVAAFVITISAILSEAHKEDQTLVDLRNIKVADAAFGQKLQSLKLTRKYAEVFGSLSMGGYQLIQAPLPPGTDMAVQEKGTVLIFSSALDDQGLRNAFTALLDGFVACGSEKLPDGDYSIRLFRKNGIDYCKLRMPESSIEPSLSAK